MKLLTKRIINNRLPCFFVSPHLDDAALSAGALISYLSDKTSVTVINVFTQSRPDNQTFSAKKFVHSAGYSSAEKLYAARRAEDKQAWDELGVKTINLNFIDALWRKKLDSGPIATVLGKFIPELTHIYPVYRINIISGKVSPNDRGLMYQLRKQLRRYVKPQNAVVFCPLGIGNHVDHLVVRDAVREVFRPIYWLDQPYSFRGASVPSGVYSQLPKFPVNRAQKERLLRRYRTQVDQLFPNGKIPMVEEKFFKSHE